MSPLRTILPLARPLRGRLLLGLALACGAATANFGLLFLSGWLLAGAAFAGAAGLAAQQTFNMMLPAAGVRFFATVRILARYAERLVTHDAALRVIGQLRVWTYRHLAPQAPAGLTGHRGGDLLSRFVSDTDQMGQHYTDTVLPFVRAAVCGSLFVLIMAIFLPSAALWLGLALLVCGVAVSFLVGLASDRLLAQLAAQRGTLQADLTETLQSVGEYLSLGAASRQEIAIAEKQLSIAAIQRKLAAIESAGRSILTFCTTLTTLLVLVCAVQAFQAHHLSLPEVPMLVLGCLAAFDVLMSLPAARQTLGRTRMAATRLDTACSAPALVPAPTQTPDIQPPFDLTLHDVSFRYPNTTQPVLEHASLTITQGERVALIGPSGSGKSSLITLLFRFYPYETGSISFAGTDIRSFQAETLAQTISVAAQGVHLFNGTVRDNLLLANPAATEADMQTVLRIALLDTVLEQTEHGLDTLIGDDGLRLSGGQAKRLTIAQALLRNTPWLILDEPTEGLDAATENALMESLLQARPDATLLCITHRRAVLPFMDRAIEIKNGTFCPAEEACP
ncbi:thiol reductant ABC exporter subunit CydC [Acetobacter indonesiensis]|uniref:thiol reductant ABC exporter subunit CydC n=1 Tax=Acetobacter indonesiensis TaxID=104101 RepID=UPI0020A2C454|nr:thiol reductant ABC exporter subunit CydC [Acetobacter indonesiensis]MCP1230262.1 thiol reductant ABC exporter subunit CydC [Acetobacter indonesiensis]